MGSWWRQRQWMGGGCVMARDQHFVHVDLEKLHIGKGVEGRLNVVINHSYSNVLSFFSSIYCLYML